MKIFLTGKYNSATHLHSYQVSINGVKFWSDRGYVSLKAAKKAGDRYVEKIKSECEFDGLKWK
jgi:hypothetical protein